jgi:hypothetical protein
MIKAKVKVSFPKAEKVIEKLGLQKGGQVQKYVDTEIMRGCDDYVPKDTGNLLNSVYANSKPGDGKLIWDIYGNENGRNVWNDTRANVNWQDAPMRGPFWALRFWNGGGMERVIREANALLKRLF